MFWSLLFLLGLVMANVPEFDATVETPRRVAKRWFGLLLTPPWDEAECKKVASIPEAAFKMFVFVALTEGLPSCF